MGHVTTNDFFEQKSFDNQSLAHLLTVLFASKKLCFALHVGYGFVHSEIVIFTGESKTAIASQKDKKY